MSYVNEAIKILKNNGYKYTKTREKVLEILDNSKESLSPYDISEKSNNKLDVVTVYRILETLEKLGLVHKVLSSGKYRKCNISKNKSDNCHHNIICKRCGYIQEIHCEGMNDIEKKVAANTFFEIENHILEFYGLCNKCK
jgi:Fe2+ or Zn2+ uptake regulation protein